MAKVTRGTGRKRVGTSGDAASVKLTVRLPAPLVRRARHHAVDANLTLQDVVTQALARFLARPRAPR